jgi:hypothetical protein
MKTFADYVRRFDPSWQPEIGLTPAAIVQVRTTARHLGKSPSLLWREVARRWVEFRRNFDGNDWFTRQYRHAFEAVLAGDPAQHPELLAPVRLELVMASRPQWVLGTFEDFPVASNYHRLRLMEEVVRMAPTGGPTPPPPRDGGRHPT